MCEFDSTTTAHVVQWIVSAWEKLRCANDGSEDNDITCFKPYKSCSKGCEMPKSQIDFLCEDDENLFTQPALIIY